MWDNSYPWNAPQNGYKPYPTRVISGVDILELNSEQQTLIGKTMDYVTQLESTCQQAIETAEKHYSRLVDLGDIVPPKNQEEINGELLRIIEKLTDKVSKLEGEQSGHDTDSDGSNEVIQSSNRRTSKRKNEEIPAD